jgi:3-mercaptopyruvate sulfurtransferase SseA
VLRVSRITPHQVLARLARGENAAFVDGRNEGSWQGAGAMLAGAVRAHPGSLPVDATRVPSCRFVVVYGQDGHDAEVARVAAGLRALGFADVRILTGGFEAWSGLHFPLQPKLADA